MKKVQVTTAPIKAELREAIGAVEYLHHKIGDELLDVCCSIDLLRSLLEQKDMLNVVVGKKHQTSVSALLDNSIRHIENIEKIFQEEYNI